MMPFHLSGYKLFTETRQDFFGSDEAAIDTVQFLDAGLSLVDALDLTRNLGQGSIPAPAPPSPDAGAAPSRVAGTAKA